MTETGPMVCCNNVEENQLGTVGKPFDGVKVKIGSVPHPMEEKHFIEWIEVILKGRAYRQFLKPGDAPEATFLIEGDQITAREYCNLHGLWKG